MTELQYDGTFAGFLTCVFHSFDQKLAEPLIVPQASAAPAIFSEAQFFGTEAAKAERVWRGLCRKLSKDAAEKIWYAFLSEEPGIENRLLGAIRYIFATPVSVENDFGHKDILYLNQTARRVWREKHRMEAFVRFELIDDNFWYAPVEPSCNVLPLIVAHFTSRYADMDWLIFDQKRKYGILYDHASGRDEEVSIDYGQGVSKMANPLPEHEKETAYRELWQKYFRHVNIPERKNLKLQLRNMPRRYWKYLPEKSG
ncbi:MAG: DNA metabolism protein [Sphingobacteriales bacterium]|nr:MAG: DNA metabolism protein [Sphingobacteriales bacterium]